MPSSNSLFGKSYEYGYGRVGVLQEYLLSQADVERMLAARNEAELAQLLTELKISTSVEYSANPHRFIHNLERWIQHEVRAIVPDEDKEIFDILWLKDDASLLSYLLKKHHGFTSPISTEPIVGATAFDPDALRELVAGERPNDLPDSLVAFVRDMRTAGNLSPQEIDTRVAQYVVDRQLELAKKSNSRAIQLYVAHHIDLQNIRTARRLPKEEDPRNHLMRGGEIDVGRFSLEPEQLAALVYSSSLPTSVADSIKTAEDSSIALERALAKAIAHDIAVMRNRVLSIDPIFAFATIALSQMRLLRTILIGKSTHLSNDEIRNLLPPFLSASPFA